MLVTRVRLPACAVFVGLAHDPIRSDARGAGVRWTYCRDVSDLGCAHVVHILSSDNNALPIRLMMIIISALRLYSQMFYIMHFSREKIM